MKKYLAILWMVIIGSCIFVSPVSASSLSLSTTIANVGASVTVAGVATPNMWVAVKGLDHEGNIIFFDNVKSDASGCYSCIFKVPNGPPGILTMVAGYGSNVETASLTVQNTPGGGGGSLTSLKIIYSNSSGTVNISNDAIIEWPAGAVTETTKLEIKKIDASGLIHSNINLISDLFEFTKNQPGNFSKPVTITLKFNPTKGGNKAPAIYYFDELKKIWIKLGGQVNGNFISVEVDHFTKYAVFVDADNTSVTDVKISDIADHWAKNNIAELVAQGVISGYPDGTFQPEHQITRAEFVSIVVKAYKLEAKIGKMFKDTTNHWATDLIATANAYGIVNGYDANTFRPDNPITREEMAVVIVKVGKMQTTSGMKLFTDNKQNSPWAIEAINTASSRGIISGYPDQSFRPKANATRAEAVTAVLKALNIKN